MFLANVTELTCSFCRCEPDLLVYWINLFAKWFGQIILQVWVLCKPAICILAAGYLSCVTLSSLTAWIVAKSKNCEACLRWTTMTRNHEFLLDTWTLMVIHRISCDSRNVRQSVSIQKSHPGASPTVCPFIYTLLTYEILSHKITNHRNMSKLRMWVQEFIPCNSFLEPLSPNSLHLADAGGNAHALCRTRHGQVTSRLCLLWLGGLTSSVLAGILEKMLARIQYFNWKGPTMVIQSNCLINSGLTKR